LRIPPEDIAAQTETLRGTLGGRFGETVAAGADMPVVEVPRERVIELLLDLRDGAPGHRHLSMLTAVDRMPADPRFEVVYALYSIEANRWLRVNTRCGEFDAVVPSVTGLWPGANWLERECFDMFGIRFDGHPDLRRILMPEDFPHHPLRKEFPREGIEPDRLYRDWAAQRAQPEPGR